MMMLQCQEMHKKGHRITVNVFTFDQKTGRLTPAQFLRLSPGDALLTAFTKQPPIYILNTIVSFVVEKLLSHVSQWLHLLSWHLTLFEIISS